MKILNLVDVNKSDIKYKVSKFPDGQQNVTITDSQVGEWSKYNENIWDTPIVTIKSRLNNWLDLELITCTVASLRELGVEEIHLYVPYIVGARSDRKFDHGGNNYLRDVICPAINALGCETVRCIDPHSDVLEACIKGFKKTTNLDLFMKFLLDYTSKNSTNDFILVSPDAGASKKIYKLAEQIGYKGDIITCSKDRDIDGKLTKTVVPLTQDDGSGYTMEYKDNCYKKDFIIIDDICDGGRTFINIAKNIKEQISNYKSKIYLVVTHGIFSAGFAELSKYFDGIYCTNSYSDIGDYTGNNLQETNVKQLNVF